MKIAVQKHTIPDSQIFTVKYLSDKYFDPVWHSHSGYQLFASLEGTGTRFIGDSIKAIGQNELILTGINLPHLWRSDDAYFEKDSKLQVKGIVIYLQESFLGEHLMQKEELIQVKKLLKKSARGIEYYGNIKLQVIKMMKELLQLQGLESLIHLLKILNLLATTKDYHYISHTAYSNPFKENETNRMNQVYDYALKNFRKKELLKEMSEHLHMTKTINRFQNLSVNSELSMPANY
jgi:hypothetical protein